MTALSRIADAAPRPLPLNLRAALLSVIGFMRRPRARCAVSRGLWENTGWGCMETKTGLMPMLRTGAKSALANHSANSTVMQIVTSNARYHQSR